MNVCMYVCSYVICNMGGGDLPDACAWAQRQAARRHKGKYVKSLLRMLQCYVALNAMVTILTIQYHN